MGVGGGGGGGGGQLEPDCGRPTFALDSALVRQTKQLQTKYKGIKHKRKANRAASIEGQVATMLESYTRQIDNRHKYISKNKSV